MKDDHSLYHQVNSASACALNGALLAGYQQLADSPEVRRSHYFAGRYENIYITPGQLPAYAELLEIARGHAAQILCVAPGKIKVGGWFNAMAGGQSTTLHSHDDDDEVLSGVYYVDVPANSGDLLLCPAGAEPVRIEPVPGNFVFFSPSLPHEVSENKSAALRLSVGMNFGYAAD